MITRTQAEALLTLAESLEACERLGFHLGASMAQGCGIVELTQDTSYLDTELTAVDVRLLVNTWVQWRKDKVIADTMTLSCAAWDSDVHVVIPRKEPELISKSEEPGYIYSH